MCDRNVPANRRVQIRLLAGSRVQLRPKLGALTAKLSVRSARRNSRTISRAFCLLSQDGKVVRPRLIRVPNGLRAIDYPRVNAGVPMAHEHEHLYARRLVPSRGVVRLGKYLI